MSGATAFPISRSSARARSNSGRRSATNFLIWPLAWCSRASASRRKRPRPLMGMRRCWYFGRSASRRASMSRSVRPRRSAATAAAAALSRGSCTLTDSPDSSPETSPRPVSRRRGEMLSDDSDSSLSPLSDDEPAPKRARAPVRSRAHASSRAGRTRAPPPHLDVAQLRDNDLFSASLLTSRGDGPRKKRRCCRELGCVLPDRPCGCGCAVGHVCAPAFRMRSYS